MTKGRSVSICTFIHVFALSLSLFSRRRNSAAFIWWVNLQNPEAAGNPQVSSYTRETHRNQPPLILQTPPPTPTPTPYVPPPPSSEKGLKSRSNWFGLCFNSASSLLPFSPFLHSPLPSLFSFSGEAQRTGMSMYKTWWRKKKKLLSKHMSCLSFFFLFIVFFIPDLSFSHYSFWVYRNWQCDKIYNVQINKLKPAELWA